MIPKFAFFFVISTVVPCCHHSLFHEGMDWDENEINRQTEEAKEKEEGSGCQ
jgi:hypothetical protein